MADKDNYTTKSRVDRLASHGFFNAADWSAGLSDLSKLNEQQIEKLWERARPRPHTCAKAHSAGIER